PDLLAPDFQLLVGLVAAFPSAATPLSPLAAWDTGNGLGSPPGADGASAPPAAGRSPGEDTATPPSAAPAQGTDWPPWLDPTPPAGVAAPVSNPPTAVAGTIQPGVSVQTTSLPFSSPAGTGTAPSGAAPSPAPIPTVTPEAPPGVPHPVLQAAYALGAAGPGLVYLRGSIESDRLAGATVQIDFFAGEQPDPARPVQAGRLLGSTKVTVRAQG